MQSGGAGEVHVTLTRRSALCVGAATALLTGLTMAGSLALSATPASAGAGTGTRGVDASLRSRTGPVTGMIELDGAPASSAYATKARTGTHAAAGGAHRAQSASVESQQRSVERALRRAATRGQVLFSTHALYSGVAVTTDAARLAALAGLPGVKEIHPLTPKRATAETYDDLASVGAPDV